MYNLPSSKSAFFSHHRHTLPPNLYRTHLSVFPTSPLTQTQDYPAYYPSAPGPPQILGFDGSGIVEAVGPLAASSSSSGSTPSFAPGDAVFYSGSPTRQGSNAELQLVDARSAAHKPQTLDHVQAASLPLTWITAYEALVERMGIRKDEKAGLLVVNGAGGVGSVALQIARKLLQLPVVIATASRPETVDWARRMGATHVVNHREGDLPGQVQRLGLPADVPLKYVFITHSTAPYLKPAAAIAAPFGKVCSIVQTKDMGEMYGSEFLAKSLTFVWELLSSKNWYGVDVESHGKMLADLARWVDEGTVECHLTRRFRLSLKGLREAHGVIEGGGSIGKNGLGVDVEGEGECFE